MKESKIMTDAQSLSKLRSMEHWVAKEPWGQIADIFGFQKANLALTINVIESTG